MSIRRAACLAAALGLAVALTPADATAHRWRGGGVGFGVTIGPAAPYYYAPRPYGYWGPPAFPPLVYAPPTVILPPPPVIYAPPPGPTWIVPPAGYGPPRAPGTIPPAQPLGGSDGGLKKKW